MTKKDLSKEAEELGVDEKTLEQFKSMSITVAAIILSMVLFYLFDKFVW